MKRSLFALAALTAFAGAASAQSSVTVFGVADVSVRQINNTDDQTHVASDGNSSSRLGFRGVEDLGGGLRAGFWLEHGLQLDTGTLTSSRFWHRRATVSLIGNFGEVRLGRDYTPIFWNWTTFDPFGTNGVGAASNLGLEGGRTGGGSGTYGTLVRADNTVGYFLPANLGGLYGQFMFAAGEGCSFKTKTSTPPAAPPAPGSVDVVGCGNQHYGGRLGYSAGAFNVAAAYGQTQVNPNDDGTSWNIAGSWNFGFMTVSGYYGEVDLDNSVPATRASSTTQTNYFIGVTAPVGPVTLKGSYGHVDNVFLTQRDNASADQFAIGAVYDLSKRTALYGTYSRISNDQAEFRVAGTLDAAGKTSSGPNLNRGDSSAGFEVGIRHSF
jgi:predicted porin